MVQQMMYVPSLMEVVSAQMDTMESIASLVSLIKNVSITKMREYAWAGDGILLLLNTRNPSSRASKRARLVAMYIAVAIRVTSEVAVSFLPEVVAQI